MKTWRNRSRWVLLARTVAPLGAAALALVVPRAAAAQDAPDSTEPAAEKAGPIMANMKIGPSFGLDAFPTQFAMVLDAGYAVTKDRNGYVTFSPQFHFGDLTMIVLPAGFQYDIPIVKKLGLYAYPHVSIGYAHVTSGGGTGAFAFLPEAGVKWVPRKHLHIGFEPLGIPVFVGDGGAQATYRMLAYAGGDF